jgi:polysaccharide biosynthesis/export protein
VTTRDDSGHEPGDVKSAGQNDEHDMKHTLISRAMVVAAAALLGWMAPARAVAQTTSTRPNVSATASTVAKPADYRLGPGDKIRIEVYKDLQLSQSAQVRPDGKITMPLIGDLTASDQTPIQLRNTITAALKEYMTNPSVTVIVVEVAVPAAYVMGEVKQPGAIQLQRDVTVLQALALAGGLSDFADANAIRVLRPKAGSVETITFRYKDALKGSAQSQMLLRPGDTVIVP